MSDSESTETDLASFTAEARRSFHKALLDGGLLYANSDGIPSMADVGSRASVRIGQELLKRLKSDAIGARIAGQMAGSRFEKVVSEYLDTVFPRLAVLRPGRFEICPGTSRAAIAACDQYEHLALLEEMAKREPRLAAAIGSDYLIKPDVMVLRYPVPDDVINEGQDPPLVDTFTAKLTSIRAANSTLPILHASVSCKFTLRSDRAQNARSEALNLVRNRKGRQPHIVVVTAEPTPNRISSIALGTGDVDCTYHIALPELIEGIRELGMDDAYESIQQMVEGKRLKDIADLPFDLTA